MLAILQYYDCSSVYRMIVVLGYVVVITLESAPKTTFSSILYTLIKVHQNKFLCYSSLVFDEYKFLLHYNNKIH